MMKIVDRLKKLFKKKTITEKMNNMPSWDYYVLGFLMALCLLCWAIKPFWWFRNG